ncbi:hypothetical protein FRACYDRAFT_251244 [Fragilariopsis cylindrus CCMP1102]|uniref:Uncharacterized protein n=1 Tax=Fragilariopsis cylindrus CCMP1102 TaxID=635003 RepID=A0A1E7ENA1_9STRA|nr:hypothetical protein FRACYDRAFT_251244 [Fragilariopsis cylindrus CCMP1102]|eukprot:OEU07439.1 hypothetical protein FRACYDRAFT_251244 [Fragilariopsis cylindrus CCMP1102]
MSEELADSIVLAARKMEHKEVEVIALIHYTDFDGKYRINCPISMTFNLFEHAYNYLAMEGYCKVSADESTEFKKSLEDVKAGPVVIMVMTDDKNDGRDLNGMLNVIMWRIGGFR